MIYSICVKKEFSASHNIRYADGRIDKKHRHDWVAEVHIETEKLSPEGLVIDFVEVEKLLDQIISKLKKKYINKVKPFDAINPTAENICRWIYDELSSKIPPPYYLSKVTLWEGACYSASINVLPNDKQFPNVLINHEDC